MARQKKRAASWRHRAVRLVAIILLAMFSFGLAGVASALSSVRSGSDPNLDADEGLLLVAIDTNIPLTAVHVRKDGKMLAAGVLANLPTGRTFRLYSAPAGKYRWSEIAVFSSYRYRFSNLPEYEFEVKPGRITYVGDLVFRPTGYFGADIHLANRGLAALDWLDVETNTDMAEFRADRFAASLGYGGTDAFRLAYLLRAVTPGQFRHPAASVENMYRPEFRAWTDGGQVVIR